MILPEAEQLLIVLGENTIPFVVAVDQELGKFIHTDRVAPWGFDRVLKSIRINSDIQVCLLVRRFGITLLV